MTGMTAEAPKVKIAFQLGDTVRIVDGPFADFRGEIDDPWNPTNDTPELKDLRAKLKGLMDAQQGRA